MRKSLVELFFDQVGETSENHLFSNFGFFLGSIFFLSIVAFCCIVIVIVGIGHFGIAAAFAATALVRRVIFFGNVGVRICAEIFIDRFFVFIGRAAVRAGVIFARKVVVVERCSDEGRRLLCVRFALEPYIYIQGSLLRRPFHF
jgi:hypothetical protein